MRRGLAGRHLEVEGSWKRLAVAQLEEAVRRGWDDAAAIENDEDLATVRQEPAFQALLAVLRGQLPRRFVTIDQVVPDSQAATLGLRADDVVRTIAGQAIETTEQGPKTIQSVPKGQLYEVVVWRPVPRSPEGEGGAGADVKVTAQGGEKLGVQLALVDMAPQGQSRAAEVRSGSVYGLRLAVGSCLTLPVARDPGTGRACLEFRRSLVKGSYLVYVAPGQGLYETRYPFVVARDIPWDETCELPAADDLPPIPPGTPALNASSAIPYWVYVPPGPYRASGDAKAQQNPQRDAAVVRVPEKGAPGYYIARFEVTCPMYLEYLNDREWHKHCSPACGDWGHVPRKASNAMEQTAYWPRAASGKFSLPPGWEDWPAIAISWNDTTDYCKWLTQRVGAGHWTFALPEEDEWEKGARGPDGRSHPWGDDFDSSFCAMVDSRPGEQETRNPEPFGLFPLDESAYGVRDLAGGVQEWTGTKSGRSWWVMKGGAWGGGAARCRCAFRGAALPEIVNASFGLRVLARRTP